MVASLTDRTYHVAWDEETLVLEARLGREASGRLVRWNGWVCPYFDRANIDKYIAWQHNNFGRPSSVMTAPDLYDTVEWDGDVLVWSSTDGVEAWHDRLPAVEGLYPLGAWTWTWYVCAPDTDPDEWRSVPRRLVIIDGQEAELLTGGDA